MRKSIGLLEKPRQEHNFEMSPWKLSMHPNCMNRGVEAKANNVLDEDSEAPSRSPPATDLSSASYVQVVVQKQRRGPCRSPSRLDGAPSAVQQMTQASEGETGARLAAAAAHCPGLRALLQLPPGAKAAGADAPSGHGPIRAKNTECGVWKKLGDVAAGKETSCGVDGESGLATEVGLGGKLRRVVCRASTRGALPTGKGRGIERGSQLGSGGSGLPRRAPSASASRTRRRPAGRTARAVANPLHPARARHPQGWKFSDRCTLSTSVWAASGALQALADEVLTPTLALSFNALARPPLVLATHFALALRDAMRPLWLAFADALEPLNRVLTGFHLVHIERASHRPQLQHV
ncbi:uncharacterized protein LOC123707972 isoform X2 [Pieris brassicae]|uniref:uncharacterized protein LOC123707972 isoform X2 n=1 Tax=Pieris brassicae TaxID=7116 RepID=UPI001E65F4AE|nr:uncharacterized protein LOC123707972 isoform X2 [Pieris brassicae]